MNSTFIQVAIALAQAVALIMSVAFITYVVMIVVPFSRHRASRPGDARSLAWHFFVPALNEEQVIGHTVDRLRDTFPAAHVWVIDDDSDDHTGAIVAHRAAFDPMVHVVTRRFPDARTGKGHALNDAYRTLSDAAPNTTVDVTVAGVDLATITLNRQTTAADGTLTVDAIYVDLLGDTQTITIGTSTCNAASVAPVPVLPGMALPIGLGALGVLGLGGVGFAVARRRRTATAAA